MLKVTTDVINTAKVDDVETTIRKIVPAGLDYAVDSIGYGPLSQTCCIRWERMGSYI